MQETQKTTFGYVVLAEQALELSPAFQGDRLVTIELGRTASGDTIINFEPLIWQPVTAISV